MGISWKLRATQAGDLRVHIGVNASCQQRVVGEVHSRDDMGGAEGQPAPSSCKEIVGFRLSTRRPTGCTGTSSSGMSFVASSTSKLKRSASASENSWTPNSHSGKHRLRSLPTDRGRWKSGSAPEILHRLIPVQRVRSGERSSGI